MSFQAYCPYCKKQVTAYVVNSEEVMHDLNVERVGHRQWKDENVGHHRWKLNKDERENLPNVPNK